MHTLPTRRTILSGASLGGLALTAGDTFAAHPAGADATGTSADNGAIGTLDVRRFGAIGDGQFHPLSRHFATLDAAHARYTSARALSDSLDGAAIQAAIDRAAQLGAALQLRWRVHVPVGRYRLSRSLRLPSNVILAGDGIGVSIIDNQNTPLAAPLIVNADADVVSMSLHDLSLHGGTHGVRIDAQQYVDGYEFLRVGFEMQSDKNIECNKLLQIGAFIDCTFAKAPYGVFVADWTTNVATFTRCRFEDHARTALHLVGAECVNVIGGRFESGRGIKSPDATIDLTRAAAVNFHGVYFEGTPTVLLRDRQSRNGVTFAGCHFTGSANPGGKPAPYRFESDGIVHFGPNDWGTRATGPARAMLSGSNDGLVELGRRYLLRTPTDCDIRSEQVRLAPGAARPVVSLSRTGSGATACVAGRVELTRLTRSADGSTAVATASYRFTATATGSKPMAIELASESGATAPLNLVAGAAEQNGAILLASAADGLGGLLRWRVEAQALFEDSDADHRIAIDLP